MILSFPDSSQLFILFHNLQFSLVRRNRLNDLCDIYSEAQYCLENLKEFLPVLRCPLIISSIKWSISPGAVLLHLGP